jgi:hypothetical protein
MNFYTGQFIHDVNADMTPDIVVIHGGDPFAPPGGYTHSLYIVAAKQIWSIILC